MCRLVGIVSQVQTVFAHCLAEAPRSLATLSHEHPDGWGIATLDVGEADAEPPAWRIEKGTEKAHACGRYRAAAAGSRGHVLIAHVRQKTVGPTRLENTHPFARDGWVFAHNGTIRELEPLRAGCSRERASEVVGDTDSELLFAFFLTRLDARGLTRPSSQAERDAVAAEIEAAAGELRARGVGAFNFLLSDGQSCLAHRFGRTLHVLERADAVLIASERLTDEPWVEVAEGTFLRVERAPAPTLRFSAETGRAA